MHLSISVLPRPTPVLQLRLRLPPLRFAAQVAIIIGVPRLMGVCHSLKLVLDCPPHPVLRRQLWHRLCKRSRCGQLRKPLSQLQSLQAQPLPQNPALPCSLRPPAFLLRARSCHYHNLPLLHLRLQLPTSHKSHRNHNVSHHHHHHLRRLNCPYLHLPLSHFLSYLLLHFHCLLSHCLPSRCHRLFSYQSQSRHPLFKSPPCRPCYNPQTLKFLLNCPFLTMKSMTMIMRTD